MMENYVLNPASFQQMEAKDHFKIIMVFYGVDLVVSTPLQIIDICFNLLPGELLKGILL